MWYTCPPHNMYTANWVGDVASDLVPIATVNSEVPGHPQPVPIVGGSLSWTSTPATWMKCMDGSCEARYSTPGGSASIIGSVFGLPPGSTLLTASFFGGATSFESTSRKCHLLMDQSTFPLSIRSSWPISVWPDCRITAAVFCQIAGLMMKAATTTSPCRSLSRPRGHIQSAPHLHRRGGRGGPLCRSDHG